VRPPLLKNPHTFGAIHRHAHGKARFQQETLQQELILFFVLDDQHPPLGLPRLQVEPNVRSCFAPFQFGVVRRRYGKHDAEPRALAGHAGHGNRAAHQFHKLTRDTEPEARALLAARLADLHERLEYPLLIFGRKPDSRILNLEDYPQRQVLFPALRVRSQRHRPPLRAFDRVAQKVEQDLANFARIRHHELRELRRFDDLEFQVLLIGAHPYHLGCLSHEPPQVAGSGLQPLAPCFDLRHVEHVVDQPQQVFAAALDDVQVPAARFGQLRVAAHQARETQNCVERRAQLMTHVGQEGALGAVGHLGGLFGDAQFPRPG